MIIIFSSPTIIPDEAKVINSLFYEGMTTLHLRKPDYSYHEMNALLKKINIDFLNKIVIHSHYDLLNEFPLKGIHLPVKTNENYMGHDSSIISKTIHEPENFQKFSDHLNYVFVSPVFNSISKADYKSSFNFDELKSEIYHFTKTGNKTRLIALGGIQPDNVQKVKDLGFHGIGVLGYLWQDYSIKRGQEVIKRFTTIRNAYNV